MEWIFINVSHLVIQLDCIAMPSVGQAIAGLSWLYSLLRGKRKLEEYI